jgi:hypothetical protein
MKDLLTRTALDVRRIGAAHSGSPLMMPINPQQGAINRLPTHTWILSNVAIGGKPGAFLSVDKTVILIIGGALGGTVDFNVEMRSTWNAAGTDLMAADLTVDDVTEFQNVFAGPNPGAAGLGQWLWLDISNVTGPVTDFVCTVVIK